MQSNKSLSHNTHKFLKIHKQNQYAEHYLFAVMSLATVLSRETRGMCVECEGQAFSHGLNSNLQSLCVKKRGTQKRQMDSS